MHSMKNYFLIIMLFASIAGYSQQSDGTYSTLYNKGIEAISRKDYAGAVTLFDQAIRMKNNYAEAIFARGTCFLVLNEREKACVDFSLASKLDWKPSDEYLKKYCGLDAIGRKMKPVNQTPVKKVDAH